MDLLIVALVITISEVSGSLYKIKTQNTYIPTPSGIPSVTERMTCALMCHHSNCDAFVVNDSDHMCRFMPPNSISYGDLYISSDIGMCHFLPAGSPSDVYTITTSDLATTDVFCDMDTLGDGWTVIQTRFDGSQDFYKTWEEYKRGFGSPYGECWIGNENLFLLTSSESYTLRIEIENATGSSRYAEYSVFLVASESENYTLTLSGFSGNVHNSMTEHNLKPFSTADHDNDGISGNCAQNNQAGWWFDDCHRVNLNAPYRPSTSEGNKAMSWYEFDTKRFETLKSSKMMIRPTSF